MSGFWRGIFLLGVMLGAVPVSAKRPKPVACPSGEFTVAAADAPLVGPPDGRLDVIEWTVSGAFSTAQCPMTTVRIKARRNFTRVKARWKSCGSVRRVRLRARIGTPGCNTLTGTIRAKGVPARAFAAVRTGSNTSTSTTLTSVSTTTTSTAIPCDTCAAACSLSAGTTPGTTAGRRNDYSFGGGACVDFLEGPDAVYAVTVPAGASMTASATPTPFFDVALAVVLDCDDISLSCRGQANADGAGAQEIVTYQNPSPAAQTVYLIVDTPSPFAGSFTLDLQVGPGSP